MTPVKVWIHCYSAKYNVLRETWLNKYKLSILTITLMIENLSVNDVLSSFSIGSAHSLSPHTGIWIHYSNGFSQAHAYTRFFAAKLVRATQIFHFCLIDWLSTIVCVRWMYIFHFNFSPLAKMTAMHFLGLGTIIWKQFVEPLFICQFPQFFKM